MDLADCRGDPSWNPIWKPNFNPLQIYLANALSGWGAKALAQALMFRGVCTFDSATELWGNISVFAAVSRSGLPCTDTVGTSLWD